MSRLILLAMVVVLGSVAEASPKKLKAKAAKLGFNRPDSVFTTINMAAAAYGVNPNKLLAIAIVESGLRHNVTNSNRNGTTDYGMFQINTVVKENECRSFPIETLWGNAMCAAKMLSKHKKHSDKDPYWVGRYHSKTPTKKRAYFYKVQKVAQNANITLN